MMRTILFTIALFLLAARARATTHAAPQNNKDQKEVASLSAARNDGLAAADAQPSVTPATTDPAYVIGPEDVIDVNVWKEPDMTRIVPVRPDGKISLPLINDVQAAGSTPQQLAADVTKKLRKFLTEPQVTVIVTAINSQPRVCRGRSSLRAGAFPLIPGMTVLQALASAGGFTTFADVRKIHGDAPGERKACRDAPSTIAKY